ncbi:hypothetical protein B0H19DRAFT_1251698 [Mycena capillaripes]|nr:hypothetical protein B0H19DRAFT_1251698 [Mycena capillaripes]
MSGIRRPCTLIHVLAPIPLCLTTVGFRNSRISLDASSGRDLRVSVSGRGPFELVIENADSRGAPLYLGASTSSNLDVQKINLSIVKKAHRANGIQSTTIWSIDAETKELKARYVDPDGNKSLLNLAFDSRRDEILLVGDLDSYNSVSDDHSAIPVRLYLSND